MTSPPLAAVVMAAGLGTRMKSRRSKHLHSLLGRRLVDWVVEAARPLQPSPFLVVSSPETQAELREDLADAEVVVQLEPRGTGDAVGAARTALASFSGDLLVLAGDAPLLTADLLSGLVEEHRAHKAAVTVLSFEPAEPGGYGRVLRDGSGGLQIVEAGDASEEELTVREVNSSIYVFTTDSLWPALDELEPANVQGELYLTDAVRLIAAATNRAVAYKASNPTDAEGVNTRVELARAGSVLRDRLLEQHMLAGVTIVDPGTTWIEPDVELEPDAVIHPFTSLHGRTVVRAEAEIGPHAVVVDSEVGTGAVVGPFCYLRPDTVLAAGAKAGSFVELKNSRIGKGSKVPHLSYVGDAEVGEGSNIAAGAITANYRPELGPDEQKQRTVIGSDVHTGSHNVFVAPVEIGDHAWVGAGSTITEDVPSGALAIARARQVNKEGYAGDKRND